MPTLRRSCFADANTWSRRAGSIGQVPTNRPPQMQTQIPLNPCALNCPSCKYHPRGETCNAQYRVCGIVTLFFTASRAAAGPQSHGVLSASDRSPAGPCAICDVPPLLQRPSGIRPCSAHTTLNRRNWVATAVKPDPGCCPVLAIGVWTSTCRLRPDLLFAASWPS
jgi:hypothetical protein